MPARKGTSTAQSAKTATTASTTPAKKAARKPRTATKAATPAPAPAPEPVQEVAAAITETTDVVLGSELQDSFGEFLGKLNLMSQQFSALRTEFRTLEKRWTRELRAAQKSINKRRRKNGNRAPSGFVKPTLISLELASFLNMPSGSEMARTEVTREINKYIRANSLQDKDNGRKINPDSALQSLLKLQDGDELTYFNLQRYMSPHFAKLGQDQPAADAH